jgi:hypothetical protein
LLSVAQGYVSRGLPLSVIVIDWCMHFLFFFSSYTFLPPPPSLSLPLSPPSSLSYLSTRSLSLTLTLDNWINLGDWSFNPACWPDPAGIILSSFLCLITHSHSHTLTTLLFIFIHTFLISASHNPLLFSYVSFPHSFLSSSQEW